MTRGPPGGAPTRRLCLTAAGLHLLAEEDGIAVDELLRTRPVSERWRRLMLERLDAVAVIYRLAQALDQAAHPLCFRWFRALPVDAAAALPDGRVREGYRPSAVLLLAPDEARLRHTRRLLAAAPVWRTPSGSAVLDLQTTLEHTGPRAAWPVEDPPLRAALPAGVDLELGKDWMLPALLKPTEKLAVDLLSDWPWLAPAHLGTLLGVKRSRLSQVALRLAELGLMATAAVQGQRRLALTDRGLAMLSRRDRAAPGTARQRWSASLVDGNAQPDWPPASPPNCATTLPTAPPTTPSP